MLSLNFLSGFGKSNVIIEVIREKDKNLLEPVFDFRSIGIIWGREMIYLIWSNKLSDKIIIYQNKILKRLMQFIFLMFIIGSTRTILGPKILQHLHFKITFKSFYQRGWIGWFIHFKGMKEKSILFHALPLPYWKFPIINFRFRTGADQIGEQNYFIILCNGNVT